MRDDFQFLGGKMKDWHPASRNPRHACIFFSNSRTACDEIGEVMMPFSEKARKTPQWMLCASGKKKGLGFYILT